MSAGDAFRKCSLGEKIGTYGGVRVRMVRVKVKEASRCGGDGVTVGEVGSFHGGGLAPDAIIMRA